MQVPTPALDGVRPGHPLRHEWRRVAMLGVAVIAALVALPGIAPAQDPPAQGHQNVGVVANPNTREKLADGEEYLRRAELAQSPAARQENLARAVEALQELIEEPRYRGDVVERHDLKLYAGAPRSAREALIRAGADAMQAYRQAFTSRADEELRRARINRRPDELKAVLYRFPFTKAALDAGLMAARLSWERGDLLNAAATCQRVLERDDLETPDVASLIAIAASCYARLGRVYECEQMQQLATKRAAGASVLLGDTVRDLAGVLRELVKAAGQRRVDPDLSSPWPSIGGDLTNNRAAIGQPEPGTEKWRARMPSDIGASPTGSFNLRYPQLDLPRRFPVISGSRLFVPNRTGLAAYDLFNGDLLWNVRNDATREQFFWDEIDPAVIYTAAVDGDEVVAPLEVPMQDVLHNPDGNGRGGNGIFGMKVIIYPPRRQLTGVDARTGEVRWRIGADWRDDSAPDVPLYQNLSYNTAPAIDGRDMYCACSRIYEDNAHVYAVALERPEGLDDQGHRHEPAVKWVTKIVSGLQETNLFGRPTREPFPSSVAVQSHRMFVCTNLGLVAALDTVTGEQIWSVPYDRIPFVPPVRIYPEFRDPTWATNPPVAVDGLVLFTPHDADKIFCYQADSGKLAWAFPRTPNPRSGDSSARYLMGVLNGRVYFGGGSNLYELDLQSGRMTRNPLQLPTDRFSNVSGKPVMVGGEMYIPLGGSLVVVDLAQLRVVRTVRTGLGNSPGNLAVGDGAMVSVTDLNRRGGEVVVAYDWDRILNELRELQRRNPENFEILLRIANLARQRGKSGRDEAVRQFNEVLRLTAKASSMEAERAAREAHRGLLGVWLDEYADAERNRDRATMTAALRQARAHVQDPRDGVMVGLQELKMAGDNAARRKELLLELMDRYPTTRYEFPERGLMVVREYALIELAELAESVRWFDQALGHWQTLLETWPNEAYRGQTLHRYASQRQRNLIKQAGTRAYATIEAQAREALTAAVRSQSPSALQAIPARWPVSEAAQEALIELALYELAASTSSPDTDEHLDAATTALRQLTTDFPDTTWRPQAWVLLAEAYESRKMFHAARGVLLMLRRDYEGKTVALRNRQIEVNSYVDAILSRDIYKELASGGAVPRLTDPPLRLIATNTVDRGTNPSVLAPSGVVPAGAPARYFLLRNRRLECRDVETGDVVWTNYDSIYVYEIARVGPLIVVVTTGSVLGLDADSGEVRYRVDLDQQVQSATIEGATCAVIVRERRPSDNRILLTMYVISAEDGKVIGRTGGDGLETQMLGKPQIAGNMILLHSLSPGRVYGFVSTRPATPIYELSFEARLAAAPIMLDDRRFAVATRASAIEVMQLADGNLLRRIPVNGGILSDRVFATEKQIIYCDSTAKVISVDPATGAERWRHEFGRNDQLMQYSMVTPEGLLILHKSLTDQRKLLATSLDLETGERQWQTSLGEDLRFDCTVSQLTTGHIVLAMRKIDARMVDDNGQQRQEVSATLNVHILARRTGDMLQTITPDCGTTLIPSVVVQDGSLLVTSDSAVLRYGR